VPSAAMPRLASAAVMIAAPWAAVRTFSWRPSRDDGGRDAELRGRDQGSRRALVAQPGGEEVDHDIEDEQRDGESQDRRMVEQHTELQPGAQDEKNSGTKNPSARPRTCVNNRFGAPSAATSRPVPNPAMSTLVPLSWAIHDNVNRTRRDRRRSSAHRRCFERLRRRFAQHGGVRQVHRIQTGTPDDHAGENLPDHHRDERVTPDAQQRARQTRGSTPARRSSPS
jgi:hypothetical protein